MTTPTTNTALRGTLIALTVAGSVVAIAVGAGWTDRLTATAEHASGTVAEAASSPATHGGHGASASGSSGSAPGAHAHKAAVEATEVAAADALGAPELAARVEDGVYVFDLRVAPVRWTILPGIEVSAMAYNGSVPGPTLRVPAGGALRVNVTNELGEPTTIHWHGMDVPFEQDGVHGDGIEPIAHGATHSYEFTVPTEPGTYFYHSHHEPDRQQALGLYGALIVEGDGPREWDQEHIVQLGEWRVVDGVTYPAMPMEGMEPNVFTLNGKAYPATPKIKAKVGERILFRIVGSGQYIHPIHIHGAPFRITATDGHAVPEALRLTKDTVLVGPGERYDVVWTATRPGTWLLHCHINHHATNDGTDMGGMTIAIEVEP